jgi:hypothetical protein
MSRNDDRDRLERFAACEYGNGEKQGRQEAKNGAWEEAAFATGQAKGIWPRWDGS